MSSLSQTVGNFVSGRLNELFNPLQEKNNEGNLEKKLLPFGEFNKSLTVKRQKTKLNYLWKNPKQLLHSLTKVDREEDRF